MMSSSDDRSDPRHGATHDVLTEPILSAAFGARVIVERRDDGLSVHLPD